MAATKIVRCRKCFKEFSVYGKKTKAERREARLGHISLGKMVDAHHLPKHSCK